VARQLQIDVFVIENRFDVWARDGAFTPPWQEKT
jgi:hypothetical protein